MIDPPEHSVTAFVKYGTSKCMVRIEASESILHSYVGKLFLGTI